jgi:hypothetical protein
VAARINDSGRRDPNGNRLEYFYKEFLPAEQAEPLDPASTPADTATDQLF